MGGWGNVGGGGDALGGSPATILLFDARPKVPSLFLFLVGGGRGREFEEGGISFVDGCEAGMGTLDMMTSLPAAGVGNGISGEPMAEMATWEMRETEWWESIDGDIKRHRGTKCREHGNEHGVAGHDGTGEGGREGAEIEGHEGASEG